MQVNRWQFQSPPCGFGGFDAGHITQWTEHIPGSTARSQWMPPSGEYLSRIAPVADIAILIGAQTQKKQHSRNTAYFKLASFEVVCGGANTQNLTEDKGLNKCHTGQIL
jgi:hypothetical protein